MGTEWQRNVAVAAATLCVAIPLAARMVSTVEPGAGPLPHFTEVEVKAKKAEFFDYLRPIIRHQNRKIREDRSWLLDNARAEDRGWFESRRWERLASRYRVSLELPDEEVFALLARRVHVVPESLVLAQAAKESGWGRSRFAREGNALFGERCFTRGCGMVPTNRRTGLRHEVERFDTVADSVASYLLNLNTHEQYLDLRLERQRLTRASKPVHGSRLVRFASPYSERREAYVNEVVSLIRVNELEAPVAQ